MKTIQRIARTELALLFYSPIAWFLLVVFLFQCGLAYTGNLEGFLTSQAIGGRRLRSLVFLTQKIFSPPFGVFSTVTKSLYLYLPLLTMGLMSRETSSGTIKLLYSSPIKVREIVFGKFLAMMVYNLALVAMLAVVALAGLINIRSADPGVLFAGLLGIYLLLCTYAAIGLFMSCLTTYQVVAGLSTLVFLGALSFIGTWWQDIDGVRDIAYFLSIQGRTEHLMGGLIGTKDLLYFAVIIYIFLGLSIYKLQAGRESKPALVKAGRYAGIVVSGLAFGYIVSLPILALYYDATATKTKTLTADAQKTIKAVNDAPLEVTTYINLLDNRYYYGTPSQRNTDLARWEPYLRFKPDISFKYVYYYDSAADKNLYKYNPGLSLKSLAEKIARSTKIDLHLFKTPAEIHKIIDLRPEQNRYVMQLKYKDKATFLRLYDDQIVFPTEPETAAALKRLIQEKMPKIGFVAGEMERSIDKIGDKHYKVLTNDITFRYSLVNQGFDVEPVWLRTQEIPADLTALVIADPKIAFDTTSLVKIRNYIAAGGNLFIAGEAGRQGILEPILRPLGVHMMDGMLVQQSKEFAPDLVRTWLTPAAVGFSKTLKQVVADSLCVSMPGAAALSYDTNSGFAVTPLLLSDGKNSWNTKKKLDLDMIESSDDVPTVHKNPTGVMMVVSGDATVSTGAQSPAIANPSRSLSYSPAEGDQGGPLPTVLSLTRTIHGKQQRIVVAGDADFLSNAELQRSNIQTSNFEFATAIFGWFTYGAFPTDASRPPSLDTRVTLSDRGLYLLKIFLLGILPLILLGFGTVLLIRRKRK